MISCNVKHRSPTCPAAENNDETSAPSTQSVVHALAVAPRGSQQGVDVHTSPKSRHVARGKWHSSGTHVKAFHVVASVAKATHDVDPVIQHHARTPCTPCVHLRDRKPRVMLRVVPKKSIIHEMGVKFVFLIRDVFFTRCTFVTVLGSKIDLKSKYFGTILKKRGRCYDL